MLIGEYTYRENTTSKSVIETISFFMSKFISGNMKNYKIVFVIIMIVYFYQI